MWVSINKDLFLYSSQTLLLLFTPPMMTSYRMHLRSACQSLIFLLFSAGERKEKLIYKNVLSCLAEDRHKAKHSIVLLNFRSVCFVLKFLFNKTHIKIWSAYIWCFTSIDTQLLQRRSSVRILIQFQEEKTKLQNFLGSFIEFCVMIGFDINNFRKILNFVALNLHQPSPIYW